MSDKSEATIENDWFRAKMIIRENQDVDVDFEIQSKDGDLDSAIGVAKYDGRIQVNTYWMFTNELEITAFAQIIEQVRQWTIKEIGQ